MSFNQPPFKSSVWVEGVFSNQATTGVGFVLQKKETQTKAQDCLAAHKQLRITLLINTALSPSHSLSLAVTNM